MSILQNTKLTTFSGIKLTYTRFIKSLIFIIIVSTIYRFRTDEGKEISSPLTSVNLPKIDAGINQKYCDSERCKFLFAYHVPEQETSANFHFFSFIQLAEMLNRTIVLVNVQHSRLETCKKFPFHFYYNVDGIKEIFPNVKFITQRDFLDWTRERNYKPTSTHRYIMQERNPLILKTDHLELKKECLDQFDLKFNNKDDLLINKTTINLGPKDHWRQEINNILMIENLKKLLDVDDEVLLIRHLIPVPLFPSKGTVIHLPFADHIIEAVKSSVNQVRPFIAIHWRMEITKPNMLSMCVKSLIKYLYKLKEELGINNIYLATDYPLMNVGGNKAQSSTFHNIGPQHHNAIKSLNETFKLNTWITMKALNVLFDEFPDNDKELDDEFNGSGIQGIFDKLVMIDSNYFISGPKGCAHVKSKFSRKIKEARIKLMQEEDFNILNDITRWPLD
ncbi:5480_t:CDS:1 [Funneliformis caledonium]|uniref:5480_t:CDS:1 n=1 Tax=Funneliformis caledonium TaxID=1117310 RepID=A0A9N9HC70_9GLOM|nr:5480_t:CDS:1 [Funneliformis caledonium]